MAEAFQTATREGTKLRQVKTNTLFHLRLIRICSNRCLVEQVIDLRERGLYAPYGPWHTTVQLLRAAEGHFAIIKALNEGDAPEMKKVIAEHINETVPLEKD